MSFPPVPLPFLPPNTIVPMPADQQDLFVQYFNRLYEDIAFAVNSKEFDYFEMSISDVFVNIPNMNNFGSYIVAVSGVESGMPCATFTLTKPERDQVGLATRPQSSSPIFGPWATFEILVTSTATNFQIAHNRPGVIANFNINIMGTQ